MTSNRPRLLGTISQWAALSVCAALGLALYFFVDLTPQVEADFFFSKHDPQATKAAAIEKEFGAAPQAPKRTGPYLLKDLFGGKLWEVGGLDRPIRCRRSDLADG